MIYKHLPIPPIPIRGIPDLCPSCLRPSMSLSFVCVKGLHPGLLATESGTLCPKGGWGLGRRPDRLSSASNPTVSRIRMSQNNLQPPGGPPIHRPPPVPGGRGRGTSSRFRMGKQAGACLPPGRILTAGSVRIHSETALRPHRREPGTACHVGLHPLSGGNGPTDTPQKAGSPRYTQNGQ